MAKVLSYGPNGTAVPVTPSFDVSITSLNFDADFRIVEEGPGRVVMTDITSPLDQPATIRIAQQGKPNVYAGTSIDPSAQIANKRGVDTIVEVREVWSITDSTDTTFQQLVPARAALTMTLPSSALVTTNVVVHLLERVIAALSTQGAASFEAGVTDLLHGVVKKD